MRVLIVTVSDRAASGERPDTNGPLLAELLAVEAIAADVVVVADEPDQVVAALRAAVAQGVDVVLTTGGTGLGPRDITPEATSAVIDRPVPGLAELLRRTAGTPLSALSRGIAGVAGRTLIVNLAGSSGAVRDGAAALAPLLGHAVSQLAGSDH